MTSHPAKFSESIMAAFAELTADGVITGVVVDPFAGSGRIHDLVDRYHFDLVTAGVELEPEWAAGHPRTVTGNALDLPFADESVDTIVTSPAYGNRFADAYDGRDGSRRMTYRLALGRPLTRENGAALHFGPAYQHLHRGAVAEMRRVLRPDGRLVLNVSNFVRDHAEVDVVGWWVDTIEAFGFAVVDILPVRTPRMRHGENHAARAESEHVVIAAAPGARTESPPVHRQHALI